MLPTSVMFSSQVPHWRGLRMACLTWGRLGLFLTRYWERSRTGGALMDNPSLSRGMGAAEAR